MYVLHDAVMQEIKMFPIQIMIREQNVRKREKIVMEMGYLIRASEHDDHHAEMEI